MTSPATTSTPASTPAGARGSGAGLATDRRARSFDLPLGHGPTAPAHARRAAAEVFAAWGVAGEQAWDALLVVSELVTNAVTYAQPPFALHLRLAAGSGRGLRIDVSDGGTAASPTGWAADRPDGEHGRGRSIIAGLARHAGAARGDGPDDTDAVIEHWATLDAA